MNCCTVLAAALQTVETLVLIVPKNIVLTPISFRCSQLVGPGMDFVAIWIPVGLSSGLSP